MMKHKGKQKHQQQRHTAPATWPYAHWEKWPPLLWLHSSWAMDAELALDRAERLPTFIVAQHEPSSQFFMLAMAQSPRGLHILAVAPLGERAEHVVERTGVARDPVAWAHTQGWHAQPTPHSPAVVAALAEARARVKASETEKPMVDPRLN